MSYIYCRPGYTFQTQSLNTQFGQIIGERRYVNQFDVTASLGWKQIFGENKRSTKKAQNGDLFRNCCSASSGKK